MNQPDRGLALKPLLSVDDTAILLGQSRSSIYRAIDRGDLPLPFVTIKPPHPPPGGGTPSRRGHPHPAIKRTTVLSTSQ